MTIPNVDINHFTIATQAQTINQIATLEGDLANLDTAVKSDLVSAINEIREEMGKIKRTLMTYAIAMS